MASVAKGPLPVGGSINGFLQTAAEQDIFTITLSAGYNYQFTLTPGTDATSSNYLDETLIGPDGTVVPKSQLSAGSYISGSFSITPTAATAGSYTISVANGANGTGSYVLAAKPQDDIGPTPGTLPIGGSASGKLESAGDKDTFTVSLAAGYNYQFTLSPGTDATSSNYLDETLIGPDGTVVSKSQLSAGSNNSSSFSITPTAATAGSYTISVANGANGTGSYVLAAKPQDDIGPTPGTLPIGGSASGKLESAGDTDTFTVSLAAGYNYQFTLAPGTDATSSNYLDETLIGPNGTVVSNSQLSAGSNNSSSFSITPTAATAGSYTISVANGANGTGSYVLAAKPQDDIGPTPGTLPIGGSASGKLESAGDTDNYQINLTAGQSVKFAVTGATGFTQATYLDESLISPSNIRVVSPTSGSFTYTAPSTGTYSLAVNDQAGGVGTYNISASSIASPVYRFFDNTNGTHFFTADPNEKTSIINNQSSRYTEETNGFGAVPVGDPNATAVYRFFDAVYGTHFFTASASERDTIQATRSDLTFEANSTFYEHATQQSGDVAVYRFFDTQFGTHFYTGDASEYAGLTTPGSSTYRANLTYEGVGFYAPAGSFK